LGLGPGYPIRLRNLSGGEFLRLPVSRHVYGLVAAPVLLEHDDRVVGRLRTASLYLVVGMLACACGLEIIAGLTVRPDGILPLAWVLAALLLIGRMWRRSAQNPRIGDCVGALGLAWTAAIGGAAIALLGLRMQFPMADAKLAGANQALGFDGNTLVSQLVEQGQWIFSIMAPAYAWTIPLVALSICGLGLLGQRVEAWRGCFCFIGSLLTIDLVAMFAPAKGIGTAASPELIARLPAHAMLYFWKAFDTFYSGEAPVLRLNAIAGVISFPSFHAAMGFTILMMWRENVAAFAVAASWFGFMILATFAYGGHYLIDVLAGLLVSAGWFALSLRLQARTA
jgi:hypothetical protein